jgi:signal transduction histidine kinase
VEPLSYVSAIVLIVGLSLALLTYLVPHLTAMKAGRGGPAYWGPQRWSEVTQQYFDLFNHDIGRPMRMILGKERALRAVLESADETPAPPVQELLDEIEAQAPNFRLMMSNIQMLVHLESPERPGAAEAVEPTEVVGNIVDRYTPVAAESGKEITWWAEPAEFGIVYSDASTIEHVVANLVDNAVRFATRHVEIRITNNPTQFFIRVWDDGPGIPERYIPHIFDRGWTPEVAKREVKTSSGLGLFIARTLARRLNGELTVESVPAPASDHHTSYLLTLPSRPPR